ncbi:hypothetical protein IE986_29340 [Klebsiella pneumoniae]|uniref:Uncharacterized protein n=1 Tax=Klebsiella pneumoniae TaxID=573 RepID=A0A927HKT4_KLEPN|nr:hypothetical protein [Klebsiella pneumoniae]
MLMEGFICSSLAQQALSGGAFLRVASLVIGDAITDVAAWRLTGPVGGHLFIDQTLLALVFQRGADGRSELRATLVSAVRSQVRQR